MKAFKRPGPYIGILVLAALGYFGYRFVGGTSEPVFVTTEVDRGTVEAAISATGTLSAKVSVMVGSVVSGNIIDLGADYNSEVKRGDLLAVIDPEPFQSRVQQAEANLASAKVQIINAEVAAKRADFDIANAEANLANTKGALVRAESVLNDAKGKYERRLTMIDEQIISQEELATAKTTYDQAAASLDSAKAQLRAAEANLDSVKVQKEVVLQEMVTAEATVTQQQANLEQAQFDLRNTRIVSPVDGIVIARNIDNGQTVQASSVAPELFEIAQDLSQMQLETNIDESDISKVRVGQVATFTVDAYPGQEFAGDVLQVRRAPVNVSNVITYTVVIGVDNPDQRLFPGMTANTRIVTERAVDTLRVPSAALRFRPPEELLSQEAVDLIASPLPGRGGPSPDAAKGGETAKGGEKGAEGENAALPSGGSMPDFSKGKGNFDPSQFKGKGKGKGGRGRGNRGGPSVSQIAYVYWPNDMGKIDAARIVTGITDGAYMQVVSGDIQEGQQLITSIENYQGASSNTNTGNPFSPQGGRGRGPGGFRGRGF